jgi:glycerol 3-phosphatase-1
MTLADEAQYLLTKHTRQLFDMDGTIIDSTPAIIKYWLQMGENIGVDGNGT